MHLPGTRRFACHLRSGHLVDLLDREAVELRSTADDPARLNALLAAAATLARFPGLAAQAPIAG